MRGAVSDDRERTVAEVLDDAAPLPLLVWGCAPSPKASADAPDPPTSPTPADDEAPWAEWSRPVLRALREGSWTGRRALERGVHDKIEARLTAILSWLLGEGLLETKQVPLGVAYRLTFAGMAVARMREPSPRQRSARAVTMTEADRVNGMLHRMRIEHKTTTAEILTATTGAGVVARSRLVTRIATSLRWPRETIASFLNIPVEWVDSGLARAGRRPA